MTHPIYPWHDETSRPHPLAVAARAICLIEALQSEAEMLDQKELWLTYGVAAAAKALVAADKFQELALLLSGLETLIPDGDQARWPLHEVIEAPR